jgi:hypothetical protein
MSPSSTCRRGSGRLVTTTTATGASLPPEPFDRDRSRRAAGGGHRSPTATDARSFGRSPTAGMRRRCRPRPPAEASAPKDPGEAALAMEQLVRDRIGEK